MSTSDLRMHAHQRFSDEAMEERILRALAQYKGTVSSHDLMASTGLSGTELDRMMRAMVLRYDATINVSPDGELQYRFDPALKPLGDDKNMRRYRLRKALWSAFKVFYKILIVVVLIGYVVAFLILLVMAMAAASRNSNDNRRGNDRRMGGGGGNFWFWYFMMGNSRAPRAPRSRYRPVANEDPRPIWEKVFSFVFGEDQEDDPLIDRQRLLAWLVRERGIVSPMELSERTGWSPQAAERESSRLLANYDGGVEILSDGRTLYVFDSLRDAVPVGTTPLPAFYDRFEVEASNSGNKNTTDFGIIALNLFVLVSSLFLAPNIIIPSLVRDYGVQNVDLLQMLLIVLPGLFSVSFFAIPFFRSFGTRRESNARKARNARRLVLKTIYQKARRGDCWFEEEAFLDEAAHARPLRGADWLDANLSTALRTALRDVANEWGAQQDVNETGERIYDFSLVQTQLKEAAHYRKNPDQLNLHRLDEEFAHFDERLDETNTADLDDASTDAPVVPASATESPLHDDDPHAF